MGAGPQHRLMGLEGIGQGQLPPHDGRRRLPSVRPRPRAAWITAMSPAGVLGRAMPMMQVDADGFNLHHRLAGAGTRSATSS